MRRVLCLQLDSGAVLSLLDMTRSGWRVAGSVHALLGQEARLVSRGQQGLPEHVLNGLRDLHGMLQAGRVSHAVVVLPPEAVVDLLVEPRPERDGARQAVEEEVRRLESALGERVVASWRPDGGLVRVCLVPERVLLAVGAACTAVGARRAVAVLAQEVIPELARAWPAPAWPAVIVDCLEDSYAVYLVRESGTVAGVERVQRGDVRALTNSVRRLGAAHGGLACVGFVGHAADGGAAMMLRSAVGVQVELANPGGVEHGSAVAAVAVKLAVGRGWRGLWKPPELCAFRISSGQLLQAERRAVVSPDAVLKRAALAAVAGAAVVSGWAWQQGSQATAAMREVRLERAGLALRALRSRQLEVELAGLKARLREMESGSGIMPEILKAVWWSTPDGVVLSSVSVSGSRGTVEIAGVARRVASVGDMARRLKQQPLFSAVTVASMAEGSSAGIEFRVVAGSVLRQASGQEFGPARRQPAGRRGLAP